MFTWVYNMSGGRPLLLDFFTKDTETLHEGDFLNLESGEVDLAATADTALVGVLAAAKLPETYTRTAGASFGQIDAVDSTTEVKAVVNIDAVYTDKRWATAVLAGAQLDIAGATGAQILATGSNNEFMAIKSVATPSNEDVLVVINVAEHYLT